MVRFFPVLHMTPCLVFISSFCFNLNMLLKLSLLEKLSINCHNEKQLSSFKKSTSKNVWLALTVKVCYTRNFFGLEKIQQPLNVSGTIFNLSPLPSSVSTIPNLTNKCCNLFHRTEAHSYKIGCHYPLPKIDLPPRCPALQLDLTLPVLLSESQLSIFSVLSVLLFTFASYPCSRRINL